MSYEDNEPLYVLNDEGDDLDDSPRNFASYSEEDLEDQEEEIDEEPDSEGGTTIVKKKSAFALLFRIMFDPVEGWKKLRRSKISADNIQSACFYPLLALLAISKFADFFYSVNVSLTRVVTEAIVAFVAYFFAYFCIPVMLSWVLNKETMEKFEAKSGRQYLLIALSTLVLFAIITNLLPMLWPILIFLPIWTLYIMFKGTRFFLLQHNDEIKFFVWSGLAVIATPLLIEYLLNLIMPY